MTSATRAQIWRFLPAIVLLVAAMCFFERTIAALDSEDFLYYGFETITCSLYAARGTGAALVVFAAGWVIWGAGRLVARVALSVSVLATILVLWHRLYIEELPWNVISQHASSVITWMGVLVLLACGSRLRLCFVCTANPDGCDLRKWQISILDLLVVTSAAAILLAVTRGYVPRDFSQWHLSDDEFLWIGLHSTSNLLIVGTVLTCYQQRRAWWLNLLIAGSLSAVISALHIVTLTQSLELPLGTIDSVLLARGVHHAALFIWLVTGLGVLRLAGYRLQRIFPASEATPIALSVPATA